MTLGLCTVPHTVSKTKHGERGRRGRSATRLFPITILVFLYCIGLCAIAINRPLREERSLLRGILGSCVGTLPV